MKKLIPLFFLILSCSDSEPEPAGVLDTAYSKAENFPHEEETIYGTWMETNDRYENETSKRRWFYISRTEFGIGQWCFQGKFQNFSNVSGPAVALNDTLIVEANLQAQGQHTTPSCLIDFPKGFYGLNYDIKTDYLNIVFPQTGEILQAVRYYAPKPISTNIN